MLKMHCLSYFQMQILQQKKISFSGIITGAEYGATLGEIQVITVNFITSGAITSAI